MMLMSSMPNAATQSRSSKRIASGLKEIFHFYLTMNRTINKN
jgi:hypothetical protein